MATTSRDLLAKILAQSDSTNDHEALAALRRAQVVMRRDGLTWAAILRGEAAPVEEDPEAREVGDAFEAIEAAGVGGSFATFVDSIKRQWEETGTLSPRQRQVLFDSARKAKMGRR